MMRLERTGLIALLTVAFAMAATSAPARAADKTEADAVKSLKGTWTADDPVDSSWTFNGKTLNAMVNGMDYTCTIKFHPKAKPAAVDFQIDDGPEEARGKTSKAIYKFDGETLLLCVALPGMDRPKEFETSEGEFYLFELKKDKEKEEK